MALGSERQALYIYNSASSLETRLLRQIENGDTVMQAPYTSDVALVSQKINARLSLMIIYSMETMRRIKVVPSDMSTRTLLLLTDIISMEDAFCQIEPCRPKMMPLILIPTRTTTQLMEKISLLFHLTTNIYSSKMEKNTTQIMLTK